ncbi:menaquinone-dependent protoporphyrinogen IX dehydrogenase [Marinomonas pollencensis]|uniref:Protoporphyrinogen IX dehydrogenase [quinone] n=1 Tax=Marinomonas pollencensis TaxID=491954 RepID=A0A3E0DSM5_9GAMM|nr:menaquinone-dependent protoporphyrinogen IX dehydrogenase [Marinomonas pollencensis]REG86547.1 menaquinone-dependent protoporphyrinogen oxidase [Marinomonas pollencensis]
MTHTLMLYSSVDGHTQAICQRLANQLGPQHKVRLASLDGLELTTAQLDEYEKIVIGASIRYGKHRANVGQFITDNRALLNTKKCAIFSVNLVARKAEKNTPESNPYLQKLLSECDWQPSLTGIFAGKVDYQQYRFFDRQMIRMIMWMTKGPTALDSSIDYTDWQKVDEFAGQIIAL